MNPLFDQTRRQIQQSRQQTKEAVIRQLAPKCLTDAGIVKYLQERGFMFATGPHTPEGTEEVHYQNQIVGIVVDNFTPSTYTCQFIPRNPKD